MTGAIAAGQYSVPATAGITVQLHDQYIYKFVFGGTATASYTISSTGNVVGTPGGTLEAWLTGTGASASNYEVMATRTSGLGTLSGTLATWLNCGSDNGWSLSNSARDNSVMTIVLSVQIRDVATHTVQASASITLSAESDSSGGGGGGGHFS